MSAPVRQPSSHPRIRLGYRWGWNGLHADLRGVDLGACNVFGQPALHAGDKGAVSVSLRDQVSAATRALLEPEHPSLLITCRHPARSLRQVETLPGKPGVGPWWAVPAIGSLALGFGLAWPCFWVRPRKKMIAIDRRWLFDQIGPQIANWGR